MKRAPSGPTSLPLVLDFERQGFIVACVLPTLLLVALVSLYPILYAANVSLHETRFLQTVRFVGLGNYIALLQDPAVWQAIWTSITYTLGSAAVTLPLGLGLALLLNRRLVCESLIRGILIMPWAISQTVAALLWMWLLEPSFGPVNYLIASAGQPKIFFLADPTLAKLTVVLANIWMSYPFPMIMFMAALKTIPDELREAVKIDGGGYWASLRYVTLPLLRPTIMSTAIMVSLVYLNMVTLIYIMTGGGPVNATQTVSIQVFKDSFVNFRVGLASAQGCLMFMLNVLFSSAYIFLLAQREEGTH